MQEWDVLKPKAIRSNDWADWVECRNYVKSQIKVAKQVFYNKDFKRTRATSEILCWSRTSSFPKKKTVSSTIKEIKSNGSSVNDAHELAETFNYRFSNILPGSVLANDISLNNTISYLGYFSRPNNNFYIRTTNYSKIFSLLSKINKCNHAFRDPDQRGYC